MKFKNKLLEKIGLVIIVVSIALLTLTAFTLTASGDMSSTNYTLAYGFAGAVGGQTASTNFQVSESRLEPMGEIAASVSPMVYLPLVLKSGLTDLTVLYVKSTNTGGVDVEIQDPNSGNTLLLNCSTGNNVTAYCGVFEPVNPYKFIAAPNNCQPQSKYFNDAAAGATITRTVSCQ